MVVAAVIVHAFRADAYRVRRPVVPAAAAIDPASGPIGTAPVPLATAQVQAVGDPGRTLVRHVPGREGGVAASR